MKSVKGKQQHAASDSQLDAAADACQAHRCAVEMGKPILKGESDALPVLPALDSVKVAGSVS